MLPRGWLRSNMGWKSTALWAWCYGARQRDISSNRKRRPLWKPSPDRHSGSLHGFSMKPEPPFARSSPDQNPKPSTSHARSGSRYRRKPMKRLLIPTLLLLPLPLAALEIRVQPGEVVYAYEVDPARGLYTVLLQNVAVVQKDGGPITLDSLEIQAVNGGQAGQIVIVPAAGPGKSAE